MFDASKHNIGIERLDFYVPDNFFFLRDYCRLEPDEFSVERMQSVWSASFFEPEYQYRFLRNGSTGVNGNFAPLSVDDLEEFTAKSGIDRVHCASGESASDMAVRLVNRMLRREPDLTDEIDVVIHYHSTLNERVGSSTPGRIQHEAKLKNTYGFSVDQKNDIGSLISLKLATEMLAAEPEMKAILLAGAEKLIPPYSRVFGKTTVMGDSASAMVVRRGSKHCRLLAFNVVDSPEGWNPYFYDEAQLSSFNESLADRAARLLDDTLRELSMKWEGVALVIPPNINVPVIKMISSKTGVGMEKFYSRNIGRYGYLMASDMVVNLATVLSEGVVKTGDIVVMLNAGFCHSLGCVVLKV